MSVRVVRLSVFSLVPQILKPGNSGRDFFNPGLSFGEGSPARWPGKVFEQLRIGGWGGRGRKIESRTSEAPSKKKDFHKTADGS